MPSATFVRLSAVKQQPRLCAPQRRELFVGVHSHEWWMVSLCPFPLKKYYLIFGKSDCREAERREYKMLTSSGQSWQRVQCGGAGRTGGAAALNDFCPFCPFKRICKWWHAQTFGLDCYRELLGGDVFVGQSRTKELHWFSIVFFHWI